MKIRHALHAIRRVLRRHPKGVRRIDHFRAVSKTSTDERAFTEEERKLLAIALDPYMNDKAEHLPLNVIFAPVSGMEHWNHPRLNGHYFINSDPDCIYRISYRQLCLFLQALRKAAPSEAGQSLHLPSWLAGLQEGETLKSAPRPDCICLAQSDHTQPEDTASNFRGKPQQNNDEDKQRSSSESSPSGLCKNRMDDYRRGRESSPVSIASANLLKTSVQYNTCSAKEHRAVLEVLKGAPR